MIKRSLSENIIQLAQQFSAVAVFGPRQSGKTTLVQQLFKEHRYLSLEDLDIRQRAKIDPRSFLEEYPSPSGIIIDEVQHVPELLSYMQTIIDRDKKKGFFVLTGSQNLLLSESVSQSLAGRVGIVTLLPLSLQELHTSAMLPQTIEETVVRGFYPNMYADPLMTADTLYTNYIRTYVERDVRMLKNVGDLNSFQRFMQLCAGRTGQLLNLSSLGNDCGIDHKTARSWISILEASYVIFLLYPYYKNFGKRVIKSPKLYFIDSGLLCNLLRIKSAMDLKEHYLRGPLVESLIISDALKQCYNANERPMLYFWRDTQGREIDCIIDYGTTLKAIEVKAGKTVASDYFDNLSYFGDLAELPVKNMVVYAGNENHSWPNGTVIAWHNARNIVYEQD